MLLYYALNFDKAVCVYVKSKHIIVVSVFDLVRLGVLRMWIGAVVPVL